MNHSRSNRKFGRSKKQRKALLDSLFYSLILREKIETTGAKASELRPYAEKLITVAKKGTLASQRAISSKIGANGAKKLVKEIAPRYKDRNGGYLRITKIGIRKNDASARSVIEFV